jgi:hypothetical protein
MPGPWQWDDRSKRYRDTSTGRFLSHRKALELRDAYIDTKKAEAAKLARQLANGDIRLGRWQMDMMGLSKKTYQNEYGLAVGGRYNMTPADNGWIGSQMKQQYRYLDKFAADIRSENLSEKQIATRAQMYVDSARQAFERGHATNLGLPKLPQYPGDGATVCLTNCQCHWDIQDEGDHWACTWTLGQAEHCPDCVDNSTRWAPLEIPKAA